MSVSPSVNAPFHTRAPQGVRGGCPLSCLGSLIARVATAVSDLFRRITQWIVSLFHPPAEQPRPERADPSLAPALAPTATPAPSSRAASRPLENPARDRGRASPEVLLNFYRGTGLDTQGRTLQNILSWNDIQLESGHDYIQWLFPTEAPSNYNFQAPRIDGATIRAFNGETALRNNLFNSFTRMLRFYGLQSTPEPSESSAIVISRGANATERQRVWLTPGNHNLLRITRILDCLSTFGLFEWSRPFHAILLDIARHEGQRAITEQTLGFWAAAVIGPSSTPA